MSQDARFKLRTQRAQAITKAGSIDEAIAHGTLPQLIDTTLAEAIVLGLLRQNVKTFLSVFGHGSTEIAEVLRIYEEAGLVKTCAVRSEVEASHAATALRMLTDEKAAVVTSIGPGAMHSMAASLVPASNGTGVWYLFGDETTHDEGPNMQQIPKQEQNLFEKLCSTMGKAYSLHTPEAVSTALHRGMGCVDDPHFAGPFFLLLPLNTQPADLKGFNLDELPVGTVPAMGPAAEEEAYIVAAGEIEKAERIVLKAGAGARNAAPEIMGFLDLTDAVVVLNPRATGTIAYGHPRNMLVGGSKGTICGNYAMEEADLVITIGARAVCQSDCSRTGFLKAKHVININTDPASAMHYNRTTALVGEAGQTLARLNAHLRKRGMKPHWSETDWTNACTAKKEEWEAFKKERYDSPTLKDEMWGREVLTQPAAIKIATDWARGMGAISFFDAGDVQANGFQIVEDERPSRTITDTGASYMGFATSAMLATGIADRKIFGLALTGDGSFMMNPQILIDGVEHGATGCILLLDNRRMAAISALQTAQYGEEYATSDSVEVDYVAMASAFKGVQALHGGFSPESLKEALNKSAQYDGLTLIHLPVYYGPDPLGGLGAFGRWNVGNWVNDVQKLRHKLGM